MKVTSATSLLLAGVKLFFDVARMIPGLSSILGIEPVIEDGLTLAVLVEADAQALMATPEWAKFVKSATAFVQAKGGHVQVSPANPAIVINYSAPPHAQTPTEFNEWNAEHPNGAS